MSFSDLMSGLLIIFILAAIALIIELTEKTEEYNEILENVVRAEQDRKDLVGIIRKKLTEEGINIRVNDGSTVITIPEQSLRFDQGKAEIPNDAKTQHVVNKIGQILFETLADDPRTKSLDTVFIEGHTDCTPYRGWKFDDNWDLSTRRSNALWRHWSEKLKYEQSGQPDPRTLADLRNGEKSPLFSISGYGETRPLPNTRPNGLCADSRPDLLGQNRRIDLRFAIRAPSQRDFEEQRQAIQSEPNAEKGP